MPTGSLHAALTVHCDLSLQISLPAEWRPTDSRPAIVLFFGTNDAMMDGAEQYVAKARLLGVRGELWTAPGQPHGFFNRSPWIEATARQADLFLPSLGYLDGPPTIDAPAGSELRHAKPPE